MAKKKPLNKAECLRVIKETLPKLNDALYVLGELSEIPSEKDLQVKIDITTQLIKGGKVLAHKVVIDVYEQIL